MGKKIIYVLGFILILGGILGYNYYQKIFGEAITKDLELFIFSTDSLVDVKEKIADYSKIISRNSPIKFVTIWNANL